MPRLTTTAIYELDSSGSNDIEVVEAHAITPPYTSDRLVSNVNNKHVEFCIVLETRCYTVSSCESDCESSLSDIPIWLTMLVLAQILAAMIVFVPILKPARLAAQILKSNALYRTTLMLTFVPLCMPQCLCSCLLEL